MKIKPISNDTRHGILINMLIAFAALFVNGFGVYLTIHASIGAAPWDVFNLGLSKTFGILYGSASIAVSAAILIIDILMREPIGIAMFIDALTVGKAVDFFDWLDVIPLPKNMADSLLMMVAGLFMLGYTQYFYMHACLGCGPRDTLLVGLKKRLSKVPIGVVSIGLLSLATFIGWLLGGKVGVGTLVCAFGAGPVMQFAFRTMRFGADKIKHRSLFDSFRVFAGKKNK